MLMLEGTEVGSDVGRELGREYGREVFLGVDFAFV